MHKWKKTTAAEDGVKLLSGLEFIGDEEKNSPETNRERGIRNLWLTRRYRVLRISQPDDPNVFDHNTPDQEKKNTQLEALNIQFTLNQPDFINECGCDREQRT